MLENYPLAETRAASTCPPFYILNVINLGLKINDFVSSLIPNSK